MKIYMPWLGEFGSELLKWVPKIYLTGNDAMVFYEEGKDILYPKVKIRKVIARVKESNRKCAGSLTQEQIYEEIKKDYGPADYIYPTTVGIPKGTMFEPQLTNDFDIDCDVVLFPRWRHTAKRKNWPHWVYLCQALQAKGIKVFACGHGDSSIHLPCPSAWDFNGQDLDASIYAIKNSKIRIGNMGALGVLSLMCGKKPWIIASEKSYHTNKKGDACNWAYYDFADHLNVDWKVLPYLDEPQRIVEEVKRELG